MRFSNLFLSQKQSRRSVERASHNAPRQRRSYFEHLERRDLLSLSPTCADYIELASRSSFEPDSAIWVTSLNDVSNANDGKITLREALDYAGQSLETGETVSSSIRFQIGGTIALSTSSQSLKVVSKNVSIDATDVGEIVIKAPKSSLALYVFGGTTVSPVQVSLTNIKFSGCSVSSSSSTVKGGTIRLSDNCNLTATRCSFVDNAASSALGTGVYVSSGSLTLVDSLFDNNVASSESGKGGAVYVESGNLTAIRTTFSHNQAADGGAIYLKSGSATLESCVFSDNKAFSGDGGAVNSASSSLNVKNVSFIGNDSETDGGALFLDGEGESYFSEVKFIDNSAVNGGAFYQRGQSAQFEHAYFAENRAVQNGGALFVSLNAYALFNNGLFISNSAQRNGGAVSNDGSFVMNSGVFRENESKTSGGALFSSYYFEFHDVELLGNRSVDVGGAIHHKGASKSWLLNCSVQNSSSNEGAGVFSEGPLVVADSNFEGNVASSNGGALVNKDELFVAKSEFVRNSVSGENGAGAALLNYPNSDLTVVNSSFYANAVPSGSGAALANNGVARFESTSIADNVVGAFGGGIYNCGVFDAQYVALYGNVANNGGAIANTYGSSSLFVNSTLWNNEAVDGGALYCYGATIFQGSAINFNVATTRDSAFYYSPQGVLGAPTCDATTVVAENIGVNERVQKIVNNDVVLLDSSTCQLCDDVLFFGDFAVLDKGNARTFDFMNYGSSSLIFSAFSETSNAESNVFTYSLQTSQGELLELDEPFILAPGDYVQLQIVVDPKKIGSKVFSLEWTTNELNDDNSIVPGTSKSVEVVGTAEIAKSGSDSTSISTLSEDSKFNVAVNQSGAFSISLTKAPSENVVVYLKSTPNLELSTDVLLFTPSNYNVPQTVTTSLTNDALQPGGLVDSTAVVTPQILSADSNWLGSSFPNLVFLIEDAFVFKDGVSIDLNQYSSQGTTRWDLNNDGYADVIVYGDPLWIDASDVHADKIVSYYTRNGVTTTKEFDVVNVDDQPIVYAETSIQPSIPGFLRLSLRSESSAMQSWRVDWGDGSPVSEFTALSMDAVFAHCYTHDGVYNVSVEVIDSNGIGTGVWSSIGFQKIEGVSNLSSAILETFGEFDEFLL